MRTPLLRLTPSPGDTPSAPTISEALDDPANLGFADYVARYSHAGWNQEQHAEPTCHATIRYISIDRPSALPPDVLACYPSHKRPSLSDIQELAGKGRLHTPDDDNVLLLRDPTPPPTRSDKPNSVGRAACLLNDEPVRIYIHSCTLGSCKLVTRRPLVTLASRARCACWSGCIGGLA